MLCCVIYVERWGIGRLCSAGGFVFADGNRERGLGWGGGDLRWVLRSVVSEGGVMGGDEGLGVSLGVER